MPPRRPEQPAPDRPRLVAEQDLERLKLGPDPVPIIEAPEPFHDRSDLLGRRPMFFRQQG